MKAPSSRDRLSVDLRGLKAALFERAQAKGLSPSDLVRGVLVNALQGVAAVPTAATNSGRAGDAERVRISIRLTADEAKALTDAARAAELPAGALLARLLAGSPLLATDGRVGGHRAALSASCAELASLTRALRHLTDLLRQGNVPAAVEYRTALDAAASDIRTHLHLASQVLDDLRPDLRRARAAQRRSPVTDGDSK